MPPELIVTSAQVQPANVDTSEKQAEGVITKELQQQQTEKTRQRKSSSMSFGYVVHICAYKFM
jgi:hypothetical protein